MRKNLVLGLVALLLFGGAGLTYYLRERSVKREMDALRHPNRPPPKPRDPNAPPDIDELSQNVGTHYSLLEREIFRQALLITAAEAGQTVPDRVLEAPGQAARAGEWDVDAHDIETYGTSVRVRRAGGPWLWSGKVEPTDNSVAYVEFARDAEKLGRTTFRQLVTTAGAATAPATTAPSSAPDLASITTDLNALNILSQFAAVRAAHARLASPGGADDIAATGALVRGYANLGQLTHFLWSAAPKVFMARSLLYAQRMAVRWPDSRFAAWHGAYARSLGGMQAAALQEIDRAEKLPAEPGDRADPPWARLLRPYCRYETQSLLNVASAKDADPALAGLATFLAYLSIETCDGSAVVNTFGQMVLARDPDCFRVVDHMVEASGVSFNHTLTGVAPIVFAKALAQRLPRLHDLPAPARKALAPVARDPADFDAQAKLTEALAAIPDQSGSSAPSWAALAQLIREVHFVHAFRRVQFLAEGLGVETDGYIRQVQPVIAKHRFRAAVAYYSARNASPMARAALMRAVEVDDPVISMTPMFFEMYNVGIMAPSQGPGVGQENYTQYSLTRVDETATDYERLLKMDWRQPQRDLENARRFRDVSPFTPLYMAKCVAADWEGAQKELPQWQAQWGDHPTLSAALGRKYAELGDLPNAEKYLKLYVEKAPDAWAFDLLANLYLRQGDEAKWLATKKQILDHPDYALQHAKTNEEIARHYMNRRQFAIAEPYALAAAESYSSWGLQCAATCMEGLGRWDEAAKYVRADAERYGRLQEWFLWCARTGHGDIAAAGAEFDSYLANPPPDEEPRVLAAKRGARALIAGDAAAARKIFDGALRSYNDTWSALHLALLCDTAGDTAARDDALRRAVTSAREHAPPANPDATDVPPAARWVRPQIAQLASLYLAAAAADHAPDRAAVDKLCAATAPPERRNLYYFAGRIYELRGDKEAATHYLTRAAHPVSDDSTNGALAWIALRRLGVDPAAMDRADRATPSP